MLKCIKGAYLPPWKVNESVKNKLVWGNERTAKRVSKVKVPWRQIPKINPGAYITGEILWKSLSLQPNFVAATSRTNSVWFDFFATCCCDKILLQRQRFSPNFSSTHEATGCCDVLSRHVAAGVYRILALSSSTMIAVIFFGYLCQEEIRVNKENFLKFFNLLKCSFVTANWLRFHSFENVLIQEVSRVIMLILQGEVNQCRILFGLKVRPNNTFYY